MRSVQLVCALLVLQLFVGLCAAVRLEARQRAGGFDPNFSADDNSYEALERQRFAEALKEPAPASNAATPATASAADETPSTEAMFGPAIPRAEPPAAVPEPRVIHELPRVFNEPGKCPETCHGHGQCLLQLDKVTLSPSGNVQVHPYKCFCDAGWVGETCATPVDAYLKYFLTHGKSGHPPCCRVCRSQRQPLDRYARIPFASDLIDPLNPFFSSRASDTVKGSQSQWMEPLGANRNRFAASTSAASSFLAIAELVQQTLREGGSYSHTEVHDDVELGDAPAASGALYDSLMNADAHSAALLEVRGEGEAEANADAASDAEKFSLSKLGAWAQKAIGAGKSAIQGLLGAPTPQSALAPAPNPAASKLAGPGGIIGANGLPVGAPKNVWSFYPAAVDPMSHPVKPCCVMCDFQEDFPRKSEQKGKYAQRIERLLKGQTRREFERTEFQNEQGCCLMCPRYDPKQTADDSDSFHARGHFPVRRPPRRAMHRGCCETCPSQFWLKDTAVDAGAFKPPPLAPKKGAPPIADAIKQAAADASQSKSKN